MFVDFVLSQSDLIISQKKSLQEDQEVKLTQVSQDCQTGIITQVVSI